jgi:putative transposase
MGWQRKGFGIYWARVSQRKSGSPTSEFGGQSLYQADGERIHGELLKLGLEISERRVFRLMPKYRKAPSQTWRAFLTHHRRRVVHCNVTEPSHGWMDRTTDG